MATLKDRLIELILNTIYAVLIDISKWQAYFDLDIALIRDIIRAVDGVIIRAGFANASGVFKDLLFEDNYRELEQHPETLRGVYFYFSPFWPWEDQVNKFLEWIRGKDFDWIELDVEESPTTETLKASYSITGIRALKAIQRAYPGKKIITYSRKDRYNELRKYSAEWDDFPYHHAQYPYYTWGTLTENILAYLAKIFSGIGTINLPASRNGDYSIWQFGDKTGLGADVGVGSRDVDINITKETRADFINWVGVPARWSGDEPPAPPAPPPVVGNTLIIEGLPTGDFANVTIRPADSIEPPAPPPPPPVEYVEVTANNIDHDVVNLRYYRNVNVSGFPIWEIKEPRVQYRNGATIRIIDVRIDGNGDQDAFEDYDNRGLYVLKADIDR